MWPGPPILELPANVFKILGDLIHERTGLYYDAGRRELLAEKLSPLATAHGFSTFLDFYYLLKYGPNADAEWPRVADALSVQETYFWREVDQVHALVNELLPRYAAEHPDKPLRIWCAACATGEEPLSIAMALTETGWFGRAEIEIVASDVSPAALEKARQGRYRPRSFRSLPAALQEKYFREVSDGWQVSPELQSRVTWSRANLVNPAEFATLARAPFIFCRNVFIYFTDVTIARTIRRFAEGMARPGYLFVGASESLLKLTDDFELEQVGDAFVYALKRNKSVKGLS